MIKNSSRQNISLGNLKVNKNKHLLFNKIKNRGYEHHIPSISTPLEN